MPSFEQDYTFQCAEDTEGKGWKETVPEVLMCIVTYFVSTNHTYCFCCGSLLIVSNCKSIASQYLMHVPCMHTSSSYRMTVLPYSEKVANILRSDAV